MSGVPRQNEIALATRHDDATNEQARATVCAHSIDADEAEVFLKMLGLL